MTGLFGRGAHVIDGGLSVGGSRRCRRTCSRPARGSRPPAPSSREPDASDCRPRARSPGSRDSRHRRSHEPRSPAAKASAWGYSVERAAAQWASLDHCGAAPALEKVSAHVTRVRYATCGAGSEVVLYRIEARAQSRAAATSGRVASAICRRGRADAVERHRRRDRRGAAALRAALGTASSESEVRATAMPLLEFFGRAANRPLIRSAARGRRARSGWRAFAGPALRRGIQPPANEAPSPRAVGAAARGHASGARRRARDRRGGDRARRASRPRGSRPRSQGGGLMGFQQRSAPPRGPSTRPWQSPGSAC